MEPHEGLLGAPVGAVWGKVLGGVGRGPAFPISRVSGSRHARGAQELPHSPLHGWSLDILEHLGFIPRSAATCKNPNF